MFLSIGIFEATAWLSVVLALVIFCSFAYMANGYRNAITQGINGVNLGLMHLYGSIANMFLYLAVVFALVQFPEFYNQYLIPIWLWRVGSEGLIVTALVELFILSRRATKND